MLCTIYIYNLYDVAANLFTASVGVIKFFVYNFVTF